MRYAYFPGCSNHASSKDYEQSTQAVARVLGVELAELPDWNCCGTTGVTSVSPLLSAVLSARNLAIAEAQGWEEVVVTCNSCFGMLRRAGEYHRQDPAMREKIDAALAGVGKKWQGQTRVRHLLDILVNDVGLETIAGKVKRPLRLKIAPYYGCLLGRPRNEFEDSEYPESMDQLLSAVGAEVVPYDHKAKCCGGALMTTKEEVALRLCYEIIGEAQDRGAQVIAVTCPMCQLNLDGYQNKINARFGTNFKMPVLYFTQLVGLALGLRERQLAIGKGFVPVKQVINF